MNPEMKIIREVSVQAENFYDDAVRLGDHAASALTERHRSQMTSLENIAETTLKSSDVYDYIKKQMARPHFDKWRIPPNQPRPPQGQQQPNKSFGQSLLDELDRLKGTRDFICTHLSIGIETDEDKYDRQQVFLKLIRQLIRQVVVQYEFSSR